MSRRRHLSRGVCILLSSASLMLPAQSTVTVQLQVEPQPKQRTSSPREAVFWLQPLDRPERSVSAAAHAGPFTLRQKDRSFTPRVLVVPVGSTVNFPNDDPFFHNVFSLYNGKRFDLGLYESGTSRQVVFNREGVSYIFCNIHPQMSAVVIALSTPWWARSDAGGALRIAGVPPGLYEAHLWAEDADPAALSRWTHRITVAAGAQSAGTFTFAPAARPGGEHLNKFGKPYTSPAAPY